MSAQFGQWVAGVSGAAGQWQVAAGVISGQLKKTERRRKLVRVTGVMRGGRYAARHMALTERRLRGRLNSAFVERLTLRLAQSVAALIGRT